MKSAAEATERAAKAVEEAAGAARAAYAAAADAATMVKVESQVGVEEELTAVEKAEAAVALSVVTVAAAAEEADAKLTAARAEEAAARAPSETVLDPPRTAGTPGLRYQPYQPPPTRHCVLDSTRVAELARPRRRGDLLALKQPSYLGDPTQVRDSWMARSVQPGHMDRPIVLTSPRLSPRYRKPSFVPPTSFCFRYTCSLYTLQERSAERLKKEQRNMKNTGNLQY